MYEIGQYVIYRKDLCKVIDIKEKHHGNNDYYILNSMNDSSLKLDIPVEDKMGYLRSLITKEELEELLEKIPSIDVIQFDDKFTENDYKRIMTSGTHEDLIMIIKTAYSRIQDRIDDNKKINDKDKFYLEKAEQYLYSEFSIILGKSYEDTKQYIIDKVNGSVSNV